MHILYVKYSEYPWRAKMFKLELLEELLSKFYPIRVYQPMTFWCPHVSEIFTLEGLDPQLIRFNRDLQIDHSACRSFR